MFSYASLIYCPKNEGDAVFKREFSAKAGSSLTLTVSALGVFDVRFNGEKVSGDILAPGWQCYKKRIGAFEYKIDNVRSDNVIEIYASRGWFSGRINIGYKEGAAPKHPTAIICEVDYVDSFGQKCKLVSDDSFMASAYEVVSSDIYDGIIYDARVKRDWSPATVYDYTKDKFTLIDSVRVKEHESVQPIEVIVTPRGEIVLDFGVNMVGYPVLNIDAHEGERVSLSFAEILDSDGNFYNENYRLAKCKYEYICREGKQTFKPFGTFYGYRYVRLDEYPHEYRDGEITSVWVHSDIERTGNIESSNELLNRLYENIIRGQRANYLDIPTDCPQRDERLGWLGDAQAFVKAASYNFDCLEFFRKWLCDVVLSINEKGVVPQIAPVPDRYANWQLAEAKAAWSDAITICPWQMYLTYGDKAILELTYDAMVSHVESMRRRAGADGLWRGDEQFGDWLGLDAPEGSYKGSSSDDVIASAFYVHSVNILTRVGAVLGKDNADYKQLYSNIRRAFVEQFEPILETQTECAVALYFGLVDNRDVVTDKLKAKIHSAGDRLQTGFVGTPYILHALSENGESELAYKLILREEYPSWLYPVTMGATTIWEHWDGLRPDGKLWSADMNSYNHYAYGACADWMFSVMGGIQPDELYPGYERCIIAPVPNPSLFHFKASYKSKHGEIVSSWRYDENTLTYNITTPVRSKIILNGTVHEVDAGSYEFTSEV